MTKELPKVSIIIPALNEELVIGNSLERLVQYLHQAGLFGVTEVIVVAAATRDKTRDIARSYANRFTWFQLLTPADKVGKGRDVKLGIEAARGAYIFFTDADLATPLTHIEAALQKLEAGADAVIGVRNLWRIHKGLLRKIASVSANWLVRLFLLPDMPDSQCGFKGFRAEVARMLFAELSIYGWGFDMEILLIAKKRNLQVKKLLISDWKDPRPGGGLVGESTWKASLSTLRELAKIRSRVVAGMYDK